MFIPILIPPIRMIRHRRLMDYEIEDEEDIMEKVVFKTTEEKIADLCDEIRNKENYFFSQTNKEIIETALHVMLEEIINHE